MACHPTHSTSKRSVFSSAWLLLLLPLIWVLIACNRLRQALQTHTATQTASRRGPSGGYLALGVTPLEDRMGPPQPLAGPSHDDPLDDFDPSQPGDPWSEYLDVPEVIHFSRQHLARCLLLDPSRHEHT